VASGFSSYGSKQAWAKLDTRWVTTVAIAIVPASVVSNLVIPILVVLQKEPVHASCSLSCSAARDGVNNPTIDDRPMRAISPLPAILRLLTIRPWLIA